MMELRRHRRQAEPGRFQIEITETAIFDDVERAAETLFARQMGFPHRARRFRHRLFVAVYLQSFPFDKDQDRPQLHRQHRPQRTVDGG